MRAFAFFAIFGAAICPAAAQDASPTIDQLLTAANASYLHHDYKASLNLYQQARQAIERTPPQNPQRYDVLKRLATVSGAKGDNQAAIDYLQSAIEWRWNQVSRNDPAVLIDRLQQVNLYRATENYAQARTVLMSVMSKHQGISGFHSLDLAGDYSLMGQIYMDEKNFPAAQEQLESADAIRSGVLGPLDAQLTPDLDRLGAIYLALHIYDRGESVFRRALVIRESILGTENADLLATVDGLAYSYFGQQKFDEAEPMYQRLIHLWVKSLGETHPMLALAFDKVGVFYAFQNKNAQAKAAFDHANAIRANFLAAGLTSQASQVPASEDPAAAADLYARALRVLEPPNDIYNATRDLAAMSLKATEQAMANKTGAKKAAPKK
jgi:tetratricopeptide (TPR) repeat protein